MKHSHLQLIIFFVLFCWYQPTLADGNIEVVFQIVKSNSGKPVTNAVVISKKEKLVESPMKRESPNFDFPNQDTMKSKYPPQTEPNPYLEKFGSRAKLFWLLYRNQT